jgi:hypothetical protein
MFVNIKKAHVVGLKVGVGGFHGTIKQLNQHSQRQTSAAGGREVATTLSDMCVQVLCSRGSAFMWGGGNL